MEHNERLGTVIEIESEKDKLPIRGLIELIKIGWVVYRWSQEEDPGSEKPYTRIFLEYTK